ncbi:hypothetical protein Ctha_0200 [Chloroherpeton thalassium ATCC 35110]|uniref:Uncharacterized protein n=1 Tax=Chloroherpeton thalassium (strain ATCC 35110 / GB-78) TaxID=517418 RepID=B3QT28_CHLT3|nr:hypothetical protein [Chloroherpeton thalassium]ACF12671.1 hypothetical protein Ctha_0200 [Chloroherpeton thalassium ATCC 35110]
MNNEIFAKVLAPSLGFDKDKVVQYIDKLFEQSLEELLLQGTVSFAGVGVLKRVYHPAEPRQEKDGNLFLFPPRQSVQLTSSSSENPEDFVYDIALSQFNLNEVHALKFSKGVAATLQKVLEVKGEVEIGNIGALKKAEDGTVTFEESDWLLELLNKQYAHLKPAPVSSKKSQENAAAEFEKTMNPDASAERLQAEQKGQADVLSYETASTASSKDDESEREEFGELIDISSKATGTASEEKAAKKPLESSKQNQKTTMESPKHLYKKMIVNHRFHPVKAKAKSMI